MVNLWKIKKHVPNLWYGSQLICTFDAVIIQYITFFFANLSRDFCANKSIPPFSGYTSRKYYDFKFDLSTPNHKCFNAVIVNFRHNLSRHIYIHVLIAINLSENTSNNIYVYLYNIQKGQILQNRWSHRGKRNIGAIKFLSIHAKFMHHHRHWVKFNVVHAIVFIHTLLHVYLYNFICTDWSDVSTHKRIYIHRLTDRRCWMMLTSHSLYYSITDWIVDNRNNYDGNRYISKCWIMLIGGVRRFKVRSVFIWLDSSGYFLNLNVYWIVWWICVHRCK